MNRPLGTAIAAGLMTFFAASAPASALDQNVFVMGGPFTTGYFGDAFAIWDDHYESNFFAGVGYQAFIYEYRSFKLGVEAGLGVRVGQPVSAEVWAGLVTRFTTIEIGNLNVTPALTAGVSVVSDTIGIETDRAAAINRGVPILYYLGPEISVSFDDHADWEAFGRIQHRSGGFGSIANIDGSNAAVLGIRHSF